MARRPLCRVFALALAAVSAAADPAIAQVFVDTAPAGNVQALSMTGTARPGNVLHGAVQGAPGDAVVFVFATRAAVVPIPLDIGIVLIDPLSMYGGCFALVDGNGFARIDCPVNEVPAGMSFVLQAFIVHQWRRSLSNLVRVYIQGGVLQGPTAPRIDPTPAVTAATSLAITGIATRPGSSILVEGGIAPVTVLANQGQNGDRFTATVGLVTNHVNHLFFTETTPQAVRLEPVTRDIVQDSQPPELHIDFPADGAEVTEASVTVGGRVADVLSGFMGLTVTVNGQPATVNIGIGTNGTYERRDVPLGPLNTPTTIAVTATDEVGNVTNRQITVTRIPAVGPRLEAVSGNNQNGSVHALLAQPLRVLVLTAANAPFPDKLVTFTVTRSDGRLSLNSTGAGVLSLQTRTDLNGIAAVRWMLGGDAGCGNNRVEVTTPGVANTVGFCASAAPGPGTQLNVGSGNNQVAATSAVLPMPLRAWVSDSCNGVAGVHVTFQVILGGGALLVPGSPPTSAITITTVATGHAEVGYQLGSAPGNNIVRAFIQGRSEPVDFQSLALQPVVGSGTRFAGLVVDNAERPLRNAAVTLTVGTTGLPTVFSDIEGRFEILNIGPVGPGHLRVDGMSVDWAGGPSGSGVPTGTFPFLQYEALVIANTENTLGTPVILPPLNPDNNRQYSTTVDTLLECEGIEGLQMRIRAGSMTLPNGQPAPDGTIVSLNQVHADKVPMPMPDGAAPPFAWTLQPGGSRFEPPVEIVYPNMSGLPPGAVANFLSFNHGTERFEIVASAHVTPDGSSIVSDPGSGIHVAGWGCNCPPYSVSTNCEVCVENCVNPGSISGGSVTSPVTDVVTGCAISWTASGATDSGGGKERICPDGSGSSVPIPAVAVTYEYTITPPPPLAPVNGTGASANITTSVRGTYSCEFRANAARECPPPTATVGSNTVTAHDIEAVLTPTDNFAGRSLTTFGLVEEMALDFQADPAVGAAALGGLTWSIQSGGGTLTGAGVAGTANYVCPDAAGAVGLRLEVAGGPCAGTGITESVSVIAPSNAYMVQAPGTALWHINGTSSAGFLGDIYLEPRNVSFANLEMSEGSATGVGTGFYASLNGRMHMVGAWVGIGQGNSTTGCQVIGRDTVRTGAFPAPYSAGVFDWPIPWRYRVGTGAAVEFTTATHHQEAEATGRTCIQKKGAGPFCRVPGDPTSG